MIQVKSITKEFISDKKYPGFRGAIKGLFSNEKVRKTAVDNISFNINKGEIVGYIGSNGAGKSTTIKMMTGILKPTLGECLVNGINPYKNRIKNAANIGVVFGQRTQLWWDLPLSESFMILKEIYQVSDEAYKERINFLNDVLDIKDFFDRPVRTLSLGQRMRADLGVALLNNPLVLYLDEPTIGLDVVVKDKIRKAIKKINKEYNTTVVLTTHDMDDIEELCDRIIVIDAGKKIYDGTLDTLKNIYGEKKRISIEVKDLNKLKDIEFFKKMEQAGYCQLRVDENISLFTVIFNKKKVQIANIINETMKVTEIKDISIKEVELSDIVKQIYEHKLVKGENDV